MKNIDVTCAIIERGGLVLAALRGAGMKMPFRWEFPGGKIDPGETPDACLRREISEELNVSVSITRALQPVRHDYPDVRVRLHPFICVITDGELTLREHAEVKWLRLEELDTLDWAEADLAVIVSYRRWLESNAQ